MHTAHMVMLHFSPFLQSKLKEGYQQLELKRTEIANLQERETALVGAMQSSVNMNKFKDFLTKVFWKKIKNVKNTGQTEDEGERTQNVDVPQRGLISHCRLYRLIVCLQRTLTKRTTVTNLTLMKMTSMTASAFQVGS